MAAAKSSTPNEKIQPQEYAAGEGWDVGNTAPSDAYRALDGDGYNTPVGPVVYSHPGGFARQIVVKGGLITEGVKAELDAAEQQSADSESGGA